MTITRKGLADEFDAQDDIVRAFFDLAQSIDAHRRTRLARHLACFGVEKREPLDIEPWFKCGERLPRNRSGEGVPIDQAETWLRMCAILCRGCSDFDHETRKGWTIACRLLGLGWSAVQNALSDTSYFGPEAAAQHWAPYLSRPDLRYVGSVYLAVADSVPNVLKIGFSTDVPKRMKQLSREAGAVVVSIQTWPGTMLHEWALHMQACYPVRAEWYRRDGIPAFLLNRAEAA